MKEFKKNLDQKKNDFEKEIQRLAESINSYKKYLEKFSSIKSTLEKAILYKEEDH
ncbi:MAG: hypothetical protein KKD21_08585 [Proteobacteria bacterium]|nr:hypothetical protein [Pseudomonadota bacterium]MBU1697084.1 hypothetical protein [Pseudomonadota bacterium]